ncbi:amidohydrolase [Ideonella sp. A 288]|uniref:amidohydrolase family protein n=1 Tax=Ideonella sp. A 288 TaxID=1962181 RepID=UPI000B4BD422|nr:amidohydrolase family protein [Ideonella sp. A 288]
MTDLAQGWDAHVHVFDADAPARAGHYRPAHRPLAEIEATAAALGVHHLVLVQPSVYGTDNGVLLRALAAEPGRHRGVVVIDDAIGDDALDTMHAAGVRGARLNLVSPVGEDTDPARRFATLAPRLRARGWHLQWYVAPQQLPQVAALHQGSGVTCVLDHLAGMRAKLDADDPAWAALHSLAAQGAWVKLSGWYRLGAVAPYAELLPLVRRVAALFGERLVWGSDWPHTAFAPTALPPYASTWQPVVDALGLSAAEALRRGPPAIYR